MNPGRWWLSGRPGMLRFLRSQRVGHDWTTELNWTSIVSISFQWVLWTEFIFRRTRVTQDLYSRETDWKVTPFALTFGKVSFWRGWSNTPNHCLGKRSPVMGNLCCYGSSEESLIFHHRSHMTHAWPIRVAHFSGYSDWSIKDMWPWSGQSQSFLSPDMQI